ncbi:alpha-D-ribose 1-methylphosphonate 5-triphosphate diphosphatase [Neoroseomonas soli]|uniref:Alpha-D-ribose 1-methylphosphonate 5-triphosphate diphosphatase n=1 Tax=Neoroseomonas soli TaxID=1081025 RepID=A0A9X9WVG4_9PROT|nr:alpha-D-ribose 1-methylphosphonate 5-triphosphate diphosphatase [Neoroseomonas soli]MBR0671143.1 alpha-D-ribose 1-methylphosphonate 5-triphosphate diphosphatase [Neoroseomonas soli]
MTAETILTNAILVLPEETLPGTLVIRDGRIAEIQPGRSHVAAARDLEGDHLIPGVVDVHTDNLERQVQPRQNARWPSRSAMVAHDAQCAAAGVTTVFDALCLGDLGFDAGRGQTFLDGVADLDAMAETGLLRSEHFLHLRCELPAPDMKPAMDPVADHPRVQMVSLMDHSPGVGQYRDVERYVAMRRKQTQMTVEQVEDRIAFLLDQRERLREPQRAWLMDRIRHRDLPIASHDDETPEEVRRNLADGITISEFPVTMAAAEAARDAKVEVIAGAPNIVRGGSHSGNVSAADLVRAGAADAFASDYVPASMVEAAWRTVEETGISLPKAVAMITDRPARMARLADRGRLEVGLRADLVQLRAVHGIPVVRRVWREGKRVA